MVQRKYFAILITVMIALGISGFIALQLGPNTQDDQDTEDGGWGYPVNATRLREFERNLQAGGPGRDGIPPIEDPVYISVEQAESYLNDGDIVFGFVHQDIVRAYPQRILVWHEIVNEEIDGENISITYCPLTGSTTAFNGTLPGNATTFGTTGRLVNSNLVMYDRATQTYFPQILSVGINKDYTGLRLQRIHMIWSTWEKWKTVYPDSQVLSTDTGYVRDYYRDPYGSYDDYDSYYNSGGPIFPVMHHDNRLQEKEVMIGVGNYEFQHAIQKTHLREEMVININLGDEKVVVFYDEELDTARSFYSNFNGTELSFNYSDGGFIDNQTGTVWNKYGESIEGSLREVVNMDVMWFAWVAFFPNTALTCSSC